MLSINNIPICIINKILGYTDITTQIKFSSTCKKYHDKFYPSTKSLIQFFTALNVAKNILINTYSKKLDIIDEYYCTGNGIRNGYDMCVCGLFEYDAPICVVCENIACECCRVTYDEDKLIICKYCYWPCYKCKKHITNYDISTIKNNPNALIKIKCYYCNYSLCQDCVKNNPNIIICCDNIICSKCQILAFPCKKCGLLKCEKCINFYGGQCITHY